MRKVATGFFVKILMLLLVASFALWGVHDIFTGQKQKPPVLVVGKEKAYAHEFEAIYNQNREQLKRSIGNGKTVPNETMIRMGVPKQVINGMINDRLLRQEAFNEGVRVSDAEIVRQTRANPMFYDENGKFDRKALREVLAAVNITEAAYLEELRSTEATRLFGNTLLGQEILHPAMAQAMYLLRQEGRDATVWIFSQNQVKTPTPSNEELESYYAEHKGEYKTQVLQTLSLIKFDPKAAEPAQVTDETVQEAYNTDKDRFTQPETRDVEQLRFESQEQATVAAERLKKGESWSDVSATAEGVKGGKAQKIQNVLKSKALPGTAEAIFATAEGSVSEPVQSALGWHLFRVEKITPEHAKPFAEVKADIKKQLEANAIQDAMDKQIGQLEDALANGSTLEDAALAANIPVQTIGPIDPAGFDVKGALNKDVPEIPGLLDRVNALRVGDTTSTLTAPDGSTIVIGLKKRNEPRDRTLDEVKTELTERWQKEQRAKQVQQIAEKIAAQEGDVGLEARQYNAFQAQTTDIRRATTVQFRDPQNRTVSMPKDMQSAVFSLRPGQHTKSFVLESGDVAFAVLTAIRPAPSHVTDAEAGQKAYIASVKTVSNEIAADYYQLYMRYLKKKYPVKMDEEQLNAIINPSSAQAQAE